MTQHRKRRGAKTAALAAEWFRSHGWPFATDVGAGRPGRDIENMPGLACEVKARAAFEPLAWLRQAGANAHPQDVPFVVWRPNGYGPADMERWPVMLTLHAFTGLLRGAGYGGSAMEIPYAPDPIGEYYKARGEEVPDELKVRVIVPDGMEDGEPG